MVEQTHDMYRYTHTRPKNKSPVYGNSYIQHIYKTQKQVIGMWKHTHNTCTDTYLQDPKTHRQYVKTDTHDTPTRPENRSPVCENRYTRHTYNTQNQVTGMWKDTHNTPTRPKNRSPVCGKIHTTHLQDPKTGCRYVETDKHDILT